MKKRVYIVLGMITAFLIIAGVMLSKSLTNNSTQETEIKGKVEETQSESTVQALETEPQVPETWDLNKVTPVLSEDNIYVPVPNGWTISTSEDEKYVNGNVTKIGTLSSLTFSSTGDYPWTLNSDNIWVSGNKQVPNSTSELISNEIEVGENGGWVQVEWSVCSQSGYDVLYMYINDTINGTSEQIPKEITGTLYGTLDSNLIYIKCGKELTQGKYSKYDNTTHTSLDSGYVKNGTFINYDENGTDSLDIHKPGGFVIYEGTEEINDLWTASKERNQFVWVPVTDPSRIYETNATTGKIKAKIWDFTATGRNARSNGNTDTKPEAGVFLNQSYDNIRSLSAEKIGSATGMGMSGYSKDTFYKELETEYMNTIKSIKKYGGFYIGRYEIGNVTSVIPVVKRINSTISNISWYEMYPKIRNISTNTNIQTSMIWGSLWDETLQWLIDTGEKTQAEIATDSTSWGNYYNSIFEYYNSNGELMNTKNYGDRDSNRLATGSSERNIANNIYDLAGNIYEWTLEGDGSLSRYVRGGRYTNNSDPVGERRIFSESWYNSYTHKFGTTIYGPTDKRNDIRFSCIHVY